MATLILYYSHTGNTEYIAQNLAQMLPADKARVELQKPLIGTWKTYLLGGYQVLTKKTPPIKPLTINPRQYHCIILGFPVWAQSFPPAIRSLFAKYDFHGMKIALFCCSKGSAGKSLEKAKKGLPDVHILGSKSLTKPLKNKAESLNAIEPWARNMQKKAGKP